MCNSSLDKKPASRRTTVDSLVHYAQAVPQQAAYVDELGTVTYAELWAAAQRRAAWLASRGVRSGEAVALAFESNAIGARRDLELLYAVAFLGATTLPLFPDVPQAACVALIERFAASWLIAGGAPPRVATASTLDPRGYDTAAEAGDVARGDRPEAGAVYLFTSGTTGAPKVLLPTQAQLHGNVLAAALAVGTDSADRQLGSIPWPSVVGMRYLLRAHAVGAAFVSAPVGETREAMGEILARFGITRLYLSPWQLRRLLQSPVPARPWPALRSIQVTGAFISPQEVEQIRSSLSPHLFVSYGCNELGSATLLASGETMPEPGCVGRPLPGMEVRVHGAQGEALGPGVTGELGFRADWMCTGYVGNPQATRERFRDGWFYPGDIGSIGADGRVYLRGRQGDVINYGGLKVWPEDIEAVLKRCPDLADAAVVGLPDPMAGQVPVAFVVARGPLSPQAVRGFCATHIEAARIPPHFRVIDSIPRNANGKVLREFLATHFSVTPEGVQPKA
ncbi:MAG TPA: long-chain fatty acid--CoA ligase [Burkholderiales bacterium]|nr:long-chain fatty acid--CoA ligase [Burkholderiales bacterium]